LFFNPAIIGLISCSLLVSIVTIYGSITGITIIRSWDIKSGSDKQLVLERKTYLVSTVVSYVMLCELLSLFLFILTADRIHPLFTGAMCAAGTLNANNFGYITLMTKTVAFILAGIWLIVNYIDNKGYDYPLIRFKYLFLMLITLLIIFETVLQFKYLIGLDPEIITSCCGALFSEDAESILGEVAHLEHLGTGIAYYLTLLLTLGTGIYFYRSGKGAIMFALSSTGLFFISMAAIISFISLYFYELPTHHCPFCILQEDYHYIGYLLYLSLLTGVITGGGVGLVNPFRKKASLKNILPMMQKKFCFVAMLGHAVFAIISTYRIIFSDFKLGGY